MASWLPDHLQQQATTLLTAGQRIPQERLGFQQLTADLAWLA